MSFWSKEDLDFLCKSYARGLKASQICDSLGRTAHAVRNQACKMGITSPSLWSTSDLQAVRTAYNTAKSNASLDLSGLALRLGRGRAEVSRKAREMGLTSLRRQYEDEGPKFPNGRKPRKHATDEESRKAVADAVRKRIAENGHPRGFKGHTHSHEARAKISKRSFESWAARTEDERYSIAMKVRKTRVMNENSSPPTVKRGSWAAAWHEIGGKRNFYRSRWESNYAKYLEWLKAAGHIKEWQHEPEVFWFEAIKRGVRSYKPDFRVWENDGSSRLHEVKGWMDSRSRTTLSRMKKYHPDQKIVLIDGPQYRAIRLKVMHLVPGWEDSPRDSHA